MKKTILLCLAILFITTTLFAQRKGSSSSIKWLSLAVRGGYGSSALFNKEIMNDVSNVEFKMYNPAFSFGARIGITVGDYVGVSVEGLSTTFGQGYTIKSAKTSEYYDKTAKLKATEISVLLRYTSDFGFYAEAGPKMSRLKSATMSSSIQLTEHDPNILDKFIESYTNITIGMGMSPVRTERFTMGVGLRGSYALGNVLADATYIPVKDDQYSPKYFDTKTNPFSLMGMIELNYFFGFWGDASCGRGRLMFFQ